MTTESHKPEPVSPVPASGLLGVIAAGALAVCALGWLIAPAAFWSGYLVAALYWLGVSVGCLGIALIHRTSGGRWGRAIGRQLYAGTNTLIVGLIAVAVVALGSHHLFPWAQHDAAHSALNAHQAEYFSTPLLLARAIGYAVLWLVSAAGLTRTYRKTAQHPDVPVPAGMAPLGLLLLFITASFFIFDAILSLTPGWSSSLFPLIQILSWGITAMAMCIIVRTRVIPNQNDSETRLTHDLGNLLMAFNLLWTYLSFSQYLIIWSGDLPQEVDWYVQRRTPVGAWVSTFLFLFHFVFPFALLLSRDVKRNPKLVSRVALLLMVMCLVDNAWTILPSTSPTVLKVPFMIAAWVGLGAIWLLAFQRRYAVLPVSLVPENGHHHESAPSPAHSGGETT